MQTHLHYTLHAASVLALFVTLVLFCKNTYHSGQTIFAKGLTGRRLHFLKMNFAYEDSSMANVQWVTETVAMSTLRRSWLPVFGGNSSSRPSPTSPPENWPGDDTVPEDVASYRIIKGVAKLPYRAYDHFDLGGALGRTDLRHVIELKNDVAEVRIDPHHGGKILSYKVHGKEQLFRNPIFQPGMLGNLGAWTSGGIEFNWPLHGHSVFTAAPVFVASFYTRDLGTVLRIYEFDRTLNSTWQVDVALSGEKLAVHPRVVNTNDHRIDGYWWTNIGTRLSTSTRVLYSDAPSVLRSGGPKGDYLAPFPMLADNMLAGIAVEGNVSVFATDHSFPHANYKACEMFIRPDGSRKNRLWMATVEANGVGFAHTQPANMTGRKYWVWGQDPADVGRMNFLSRCKLKDGQPSEEGCEGSYLEMQAGPAPTQSNFFPVEEERSWTEVFVPFTGVVGAHTVGTDGYKVALNSVGQIVANQSDNIATLEHRLASLERLGPQELDSWQILHYGSGFGRVHEKLIGHTLTPSLDFSKVVDGESEPWFHLVTSGSFAKNDLDEIAPASFMVDWPYIERLRNANETWLQQLHLGIALRQQGQTNASHNALQRSVDLRPLLNPLALVLLGQHKEAWKQISVKTLSADPTLIEDIAEAWVQSFLTPTGVKDGLAEALADMDAAKVDSQRIRAARIAHLVYGVSSKEACQQAVNLLLTSEWAVSDRTLTRLWRDSWYCIEDATSSIAKHQSRVAHPPPRFIDFNGAT